MAVWRQHDDNNCVTATAVLSAALTVLGVDHYVAPVAVLVEDALAGTRGICGRAAFTLAQSQLQSGNADEVAHAESMVYVQPEDADYFWDEGGYAIVVCPTANLLIDATFDVFGTELPYLVADAQGADQHKPSDWSYSTATLVVRYLAVQDQIILDATIDFATRMMGREIAGVGMHVGFDWELLNQIDHALYLGIDRLDETLASFRAGDSRLQDAFRAQRDASLSGLGYPGAVEFPDKDPWDFDPAGCAVNQSLPVASRNEANRPLVSRRWRGPPNAGQSEPFGYRR